MKRLGLSPGLLAATLFLGVGVRAEETNPNSKTDPQSPRVASGMMAQDRAADLLKRFDKNGDGKLDEDELAEAHEAMLREQMARRTAASSAAPDAAKMRARALAMFDKDGDGRLSDDERAEMQRQLQEFRPAAFGSAPNRAALLRRFDKDGDGKIDAAEMAELEKTVRPLMELSPDQLRRHDKNGDGKLDDAEWQAVREEIARWFGAEPPAGAGPAVGGNVKAEQARLERVAEEVRRRRAEREKLTRQFAAGSTPPAAAPTAPAAEQLPVMTDEERAQLSAMDREVARRAALREKSEREKSAK